MNDQSKNLPTVIDTGTLAVLNKSEIDTQIATAKQYPRDIKRIQQQAHDLATLDEATAAECMYAMPRDNKVIEGPSIRFAEILASTFGNCRAGARIIEEGMEFVTAQGVFHDLEANSVVTYEVKRRITNKAGRRYNADMIATTANAACSIALRNVILRGIPQPLWTSIYEASRKKAAGDATTLPNRRAQALKAFQTYGVDAPRILALLQIGKIEDMTAQHIVKLQGLYQAIRDGELTPENAFPLPDAPKKENVVPKTIEEFGGSGGGMRDGGTGGFNIELESIDPHTGEIKTTVPDAFQAGYGDRQKGKAIADVPRDWKYTPLGDAWIAGYVKATEELTEQKKT